VRVGVEHEAAGSAGPAGSPPFRGVGVALVTLFDDDGEVDAKATGALAAELAGHGIAGVLVAGTTGEAGALDAAERVALVRAVRAALPPGVALLAGTGAPSARQARRFTADAAAEGVDGLVALSPPGTADPRPYYDELARVAGDIPLLAYHYPRASAPGFPSSLLGDLPVAGCKDSSGDPARLAATLASWDGWLYVGAAPLALTAGALGATGVILALANAEPERCVAAFAGDAGAQLALADAQAASEAGFPSGIKTLVARRFGCSERARLHG